MPQARRTILPGARGTGGVVSEMACRAVRGQVKSGCKICGAKRTNNLLIFLKTINEAQSVNLRRSMEWWITMVMLESRVMKLGWACEDATQQKPSSKVYFSVHTIGGSKVSRHSAFLRRVKKSALSSTTIYSTKMSLFGTEISGNRRPYKASDYGL